TVNVIVAQRLVRKLCPDCRKEYKMGEKELAVFKKNYDMDQILESLKKSEFFKGKIDAKSGWSDIKLFKAGGCEQCTEGYKGRLGLFEVLEMDEDIKKMISQKASAEELDNKAREAGMISMIEDGFIKAAQGVTSLEEILRVTKE
ncbi:MAG TPA: hypothetical protein PLK35_03575, partial [Candidatus Moranbacteria bacterium]|nr:hypothetical protein [Candidatus Moranbacteria bacterium]